MSAAVDALIRDLLDWLVREERSYDDVLEAWRTSCPRLPVWEDANARGFVSRETSHGQPVVKVTAKGRAFLAGSAHAA